MPLEWNGDALIARVEQAARDGVNDTVDAARDDAEATHPWKDDPRPRRLRKDGPLVDPKLELQIRSEHAAAGEANPTARFGYTRRKGFYGLFHEESTTHEHEFPTIRPAADRQFPTLSERIARRFRG